MECKQPHLEDMLSLAGRGALEVLSAGVVGNILDDQLLVCPGEDVDDLRVDLARVPDLRRKRETGSDLMRGESKIRGLAQTG
jgi:hypothetical protein